MVRSSERIIGDGDRPETLNGFVRGWGITVSVKYG
jgi:hypothetical protein